MTKFFLNTIIFLALSFLFAGCEKEEMMPTTEPGEEVMCCVEFGHRDFDNVEITTKATLDIIHESRVLNVYVFLFDQNGKRIYSKFFDKNNKKETEAAVTSANENCWYGATTNTGVTTGTIRIKAPKITNATLYLVANLDSDMLSMSPELFNSVTTMSELEAMSATMLQTITSRNGYFPMTSKVQGVTVNKDYISSGKAQLERLDSKITLNITLANSKELIAFLPDKVVVRNLPKGTRIANASGTPDFEEAGYFDSEVLFDQLTTNSEGNVNGATCSFYMLENRESAKKKNTVGNYHLRDQRIKNADGSYNTDNGMWLNAPEYSTYLEIHGELQMDITNVDAEMVGDVTYYVHLGDFSANVNNYDVIRNTHYTYNITVYGVDEIRAEVYRDEENQSGATGHIYTSFEAHHVYDAHYGQRVFTMYADDVDIHKISFYVKTPFGREGTPEQFGGGYNISDLDYKWVTFLRNKIDTSTGCYSNNNRIYPGDESQMLISQGSTERLMNVVELIDFVKAEKIKLDDYIAGGSVGANPSAFLKNSSGKYIINFTAFVNEFHYDTHPTENIPITWQDFVNQPKRMMHILADSQISFDEESSITESIVTFRQRSIQTPYNINKKEIVSAFGAETIDETKELNLPFYENDNNYRNVDFGNNSTQNGLYNSVCLWTLLSSDGKYKSGSNRERWDTYLNYEVPNSHSDVYNFVRDGKVCMRYSGLARNRDNNGNGYIDPDEVRWYIGSLQDLYTLYVGDLGIDPEAHLYPVAQATLPNQQVNGVWIWRNHIVTSSQTTITTPSQYIQKLWPDMLWAEEGVSVSGYGQEWNKPAPKSIRMMRNLGLPYPTETTIADRNENIPEPMIKASDKGGGVYHFDLSNINDKSVRYFTTHELIPINENGESSRSYYGFETHPQFQDYSSDYANIKTKLEAGYSFCPDGYRLPNVREGAMMSLYCPAAWWNNKRIFSSSYYSHGVYCDNYDNGTVTWLFENKYVTLSATVTSVRCVKDLK